MHRRPLLQRLDVPSVAVFRALPLGDMLCAVPALRALRKALPHARIVLVGLPWASQFAARFNSYIDEFVSFPGHPLLPEQTVDHGALANFYADMCARGFALAIQLHGASEVGNDIAGGFGARVLVGSHRGAPVTRAKTVMLPYPDVGAEPERLLGLMQRIGAVPAGDALEFPLSPEDDDELDASGIASRLSPGAYFCIHAGARTRERRWPAARFAEVGDRIADEFGLQAVLTGTNDDADQAADLAAHMRTKPLVATASLSIGATAALLRGAVLLLCNDAGISHLAAGLHLKSVVVFTQADIARWAPLDRLNHRCIWDPTAERGAIVLHHARALLAGIAPSRQRSVGMWPYW